MPKARYNLDSPNQIKTSCDLANLDSWLLEEAVAVENLPVRNAILQVCDGIEAFIRWPQKELLLWRGCHRVKEPGTKQKLHKYPEDITLLLRSTCVGLNLDTRSNGPAIAAFIAAGGERPGRFGSRNSWSIHHLYSGKFPYIEKAATLHAAKDGLHFTQSAGLIAVHPMAEGLCDEYPFFAWFLRAKAFSKFGYDPDRVFASEPLNEFGFVGKKPLIIYEGDKC